MAGGRRRHKGKETFKVFLKRKGTRMGPGNDWLGVAGKKRVNGVERELANL